jgi:RNA polymerase sporulation-specific sigma factor
LIYGEIRRYIRDDGMIKISRKLKELNYKINNIRADYIAEYGTEPTIETIKQHIGCTVEEITLATEACRCVESIDANLCDDVSTLSLIQRIKNNDCEEDRTIARLDLMESLSSLNEKERLIIFMRYISDKTQAEVGKKLGLSQVQVSRLERKSLTVIKKYMSG